MMGPSSDMKQVLTRALDSFLMGTGLHVVRQVTGGGLEMVQYFYSWLLLE